jgi:hypothetical protein
MISRIRMSRCGVSVSESVRSLPQRSQVVFRNQDGNAFSGWSRASAGEGRGSPRRRSASGAAAVAGSHSRLDLPGAWALARRATSTALCVPCAPPARTTADRRSSEILCRRRGSARTPAAYAAAMSASPNRFPGRLTVTTAGWRLALTVAEPPARPLPVLTAAVVGVVDSGGASTSRLPALRRIGGLDHRRHLECRWLLAPRGRL